MERNSSESGAQNQDIQEAKPLGINYEHKADESFKAKAFKFTFRMLGVKRFPLLKSKLKSGKDFFGEEPEPPKRLKKNFDYTSWQVDGRNVFSFTPKQNKTQKHILYLHGGAYIMNNTRSTWSLTERLVNENNCTVIVPDYPLAPAQTYLDCYKCIDQIYKELISRVDPSDVIFMGDSAGGGFVLGYAQKCLQEGIPQPAHIIMMSPWLDITCSNPEIYEIDKDDVLLDIESLKMVAESYTKDGDINSHLIRPINGPIEGLGRMSLFISTHDIAWADARTFKTMCDEKKIAINYYVYPKMMHDWVLFGFAETDKVFSQIKELIC